MFLQGNLPLETKESGTLLGRFWRGIWSWEDCFLIGRFKKKKKRRKEIGEFSFLETNLGLKGWYIYVRKEREEGSFFERRIFFSEEAATRIGGNRLRGEKERSTKKTSGGFLRIETSADFFYLTEVSIPRYVYCKFLLYSHYPFIMY